MSIQRVHTVSPEQASSVQSLAWSPDGSYLAAGAENGVLTLWTGPQATLVQRWEVIPTRAGQALLDSRAIRAVAWHPQSGMIATGDVEGYVKIWRPGELQPFKAHSKHRDWVYGVAFSRDGSKLASSSGDGTVLIWPFEKANTARKITGTAKAVLTCVAWTADETCVVVGSRKNTVWIYPLNVGEPNRMLRKHSDDVTSVTVSDDGKLLATTGRDGLICLWNLETRKLLRVLEGHEGRVYTATFVAGSDFLVSGGNAGMMVWNLASGTLLQRLPEIGVIRSLSWNPSLRLLASGGDQGVSLWRMAAGM